MCFMFVWSEWLCHVMSSVLFTITATYSWSAVGTASDDGSPIPPRFPGPTVSCLGCSFLWPHPPTSSGGSGYLSHGCFEASCFFLFLLGFVFATAWGVVVCCMLALSSSSPLCWRLREAALALSQLTPPRLQPFCSVNPHCLVILFKLTWMLLFGFGACGSFFLNIYIYIFLFCLFSESMFPCF